jgi:hypothetical protein
MKKLIPVLLLPLLLLASCGIGGAEKVAQSYHNSMINEDYESIVNNNISDDGLEITSKSEWISLFESVKNEYGAIKSIEKLMGFSTKTNNGTTTVTMRYSYIFKDGSEIFERLIFMKSKGEKLKIAGIAFNEDLDNLPMPD